MVVSPRLIARQMIKIQKSVFENSSQTMEILQNHTEKMVHTVLKKSEWIPEESKKSFEDWSNLAKQGQAQLTASLNEGFDFWENMLSV